MPLFCESDVQSTRNRTLGSSGISFAQVGTLNALVESEVSFARHATHAAFAFRTLEITTFERENAASNLRKVLVAQLDPVTFG